MVEAGFFSQGRVCEWLRVSAQNSERIGIGCIFRPFKAHRDMALCGKVVDLVRLRLLDNTNQAGAIRHILVMEENEPLFMAVLAEVINTVGIEKAGATFDARTI